MAILQTELATGQKQAPQAYTSGASASYLSTFTIPAGMTVAAGDIVELGPLPAEHRIVAATIIPSGNFGAGVTADIGIMSGEFGDKDSVRTSGAELFDDVALTAMASLTKGDSILLATSDDNRGIGVKFSASVAGAGQKLSLLLVYAQ
jgi:hypothetical protein